MGGISSSTTFYILLLFVSIYVFSISSYTYISSLSNVDLWKEKQNDIQLRRLKRDASDTSKDSWTQNITFNICCGENQRISEKLKCVEAPSGHFAEQIEEVLKTLVVDENMTGSFINSSRVDLRFNNSDFLTSDERVVVHWSPTKSATHYISQEDGSLVELNLDGKGVLSKFSTSSFCLDRINNTERKFVALVKPCMEKMCIQKCCPKGFYYNTADNKCKIEEEIVKTSFEPRFYNATQETAINLSYFMIEGVPKCLGPDTQIKIHENPSPIYIQQDGYLMIISESEGVKSFYDEKKYCVDWFSDGTEDNTYANGFYCQNYTMLRVPYIFGTENPTPKQNALAENPLGKNMTGRKFEHLKDNIAKAMDIVGKKIEDVAVMTKDKTIETGKKVVSRLGQARSSADRFVGFTILELLSLVMYLF